MAVNNVWVLDIVYRLNKNGTVRDIARFGFLDRGRGAISLDIAADGRYRAVYLSRAAWTEADLDEERRTAIFHTIDTYQPLNQAVLVAVSPVDDNHFEVTTCLLKLD